MRIGIVGKGNVARCLGPLWSSCGHQIAYGVRSPDAAEAAELVALTGRGSRTLPVSQLPGVADLILLSVRWRDVAGVLEELGDTKGKILIDCITPMERGQKQLLFGFDTSAAEQIAALAPDAHVVKAFDSCGVGTMRQPVFGGVRATILICGNDSAAKAMVSQLAEDIGFEAYDAGGVEMARYMEPLSMLWVELALVQGRGMDLGFKVLTRQGSPAA